MKPHITFLLSAGISAALSISAQAGGHHGGNGGSNSSSAPASASSSARSAGPATFHSTGAIHYNGGGRMISSPTRYSALHPGSASISQRQFTAGTIHRPLSGGIATQSDRNRTRNLGALHSQRDFRNRSFANNTNRAAASNRHVFARHLANQHPNWDRHHDHFWNGHRCRWVNNCWIIFDIGFSPWYGWPYDYYAYGYPYPYGYGYPYAYPYGYGYGYNNDNYNGDQDDNNVYQGQQVQPDYNGDDGKDYYRDSSHNQGTGSTVSAAQQRLAREGYYRGQIDGVFGPEMRRAIGRYQSNNRLRVTGTLTPETLQALSLQRVARE